MGSKQGNLPPVGVEKPSPPPPPPPKRHARGEVGPIYGVVLLDSLPMDGGGMRQALPSREDLKQVSRQSMRTVAGYEVLLEHYYRSQNEVERLRKFEQAMESMAAQIVCPRRTATEMAEEILGVKGGDA